MRIMLKKFNKHHEGQSLVEFALVVPIYILILMGIIEFGRAWMTMNILSSASREGARIAAVTGPDVSSVNTAVQNVLSASNLPSGTINVSGPNSNREVRVTVTINYNPITGGLVPGLSNSIQLSRTTTMRWEG